MELASNLTGQKSVKFEESHTGVGNGLLSPALSSKGGEGEELHDSSTAYYEETRHARVLALP